MAYQYQSATPVADAAKFSLSQWFWLPSVGGTQLNGTPQSLLNWGLNGPDDLLKASTIVLQSAASLWRFRVFCFGGGVVNPAPPPPFMGMNNTWLGATMATIGSQTFDAWHHLAIGYDGSQGIGGFQGLSASPVFKVRIDGVVASGVATASSAAASSIFDAGRASNGMYVEGFPVGLPVTPEQEGFPLQFTHKIAFGHTMMWFGTYIDFSDAGNFAKFVTERGGRGIAASPATAIAEFGEPHLWFEGNAKQFKTNRGTGGEFTQVGTLTDFTPIASYDLVE
jgi:hypothetical protein